MPQKSLCRVFSNIFNPPQVHLAKILLLGVDTVGKTSLLYRLKLDKFLRNVIPTIGVNVETVEFSPPSTKSKIMNELMQITIWDFGGCGRIHPLVRPYMNDPFTLLFLIDVLGNNFQYQRLTDQIEELIYQVKVGVEQSGYCAFVVVGFTKGDMLEDMIEGESRVQQARCFVQEELRKLDLESKGAKWEVLEDVISAKTGRGLAALLEALAMGSRKVTKKSSCVGSYNPAEMTIKSESIPKSPTEEELIERIQKGYYEGDNQLPAETFLHKMLTGELEKWDHRRHLRAGLMCLVEALTSPKLTQRPGAPHLKATSIFLGHLETMLQSSSAKGIQWRNTKHRTLTIFWEHHIYISLLGYMETITIEKVIEPQEFHNFLVAYPHLMNGQLWTAYYTKDALFGKGEKGNWARENWTPPDLQNLPGYALKKTAPPIVMDPKLNHENKNKKDDNTKRYKRFAFAILQKDLGANSYQNASFSKVKISSRGQLLKASLPELQRQIMRIRAEGLKQGQEIDPYSETKAYFWVQIIHAGWAELHRGGHEVDISSMQYETFVLLYPSVLDPPLLQTLGKASWLRGKNASGPWAGSEIWKQYYSEKLWDCVEGRIQVLPPDLKPLPNIQVIATTNPQSDHLIEKPITEDVAIPTVEELIVNVQDNLEWLVEGDDEESLSPHISHMRKIFERLVAASATFRRHGSVSESVFPARELAHIALQPLPHASNSTNSQLSLTAKLFWTRLTFSAFIHGNWGMCPIPNKVETANGPCTKRDFQEFLKARPELAWEELWRVYYTQQQWESIDAQQGFLEGDRRQLSDDDAWPADILADGIRLI